MVYTFFLHLSCSHHWSLVEKTSVKKSIKCKVCSNFQMSFLHLDGPPVVEAAGQVDIFVISTGQVDL